MTRLIGAAHGVVRCAVPCFTGFVHLSNDRLRLLQEAVDRVEGRWTDPSHGPKSDRT